MNTENTDTDDRFRQLVSELVDTAPEPLDWSLVANRSPVAPPSRSHRPLAVAAAGALVVAGAGVAAVAVLDNDLGEGSRRAVEEPGTTVAGEPSVAFGGGAQRCVEQYDLTTLANRAFAFDGTVTSIGTTERPAYRDAPPDTDVEVTFEVHEWFAPDGPDTVVVELLAPGWISSNGTVAYEVGSRLLITGEPRWGGAPLDDPVVWYCGFSRTWDEPTADAWREVFAASG